MSSEYLSEYFSLMQAACVSNVLFLLLYLFLVLYY